MIHTAFTITDNEAHIIIKDASLRIIQHEQIELSTETSQVVREWHACRHAIRLSAQHGKALRLYSDLSVIDDLRTIPEASYNNEYAPLSEISISMTIEERAEVVRGWGANPDLPRDGKNRERSLYFNTVSMLLTLFPGRWDVVKVERERIINSEAA